MDYTILYSLLIVVGVLGVIFGVAYLRKKNIIEIDVDDLLFIVTAFGLTMDIIDELDLKFEPKIKQIRGILEDTMDFVIANYTDDVDMQNVAYNYAIGLAEKIGLELTDARKVIIAKLIDIGLQNIQI